MANREQAFGADAFELDAIQPWRLHQLVRNASSDPCPQPPSQQLANMVGMLSGGGP